MALRIGLGFPTCREGQTYRVPYVRPDELAALARRAEALGFYSLWGNDHLATPRLIRATLDRTPSFYEPLITFATLAGVTERLRFMLSVLVLPQRDPVLLAKQVATLDVLSGGRVMLGLGIGGYRDEVEAVRPDLKQANRGVVLDESLEALRLLFDDPVASYDGRHVRFENVDLAPKPLQRPFPILLGASGPAGLRRAARFADGWIAAAGAGSALETYRARLDAALIEQGRDPSDVATHYQTWLSFGRGRAEAEAKLRRSQHFRRILAHQHETGDEAAALEHFRSSNLLGTPDEVIEQIRAFERAGVSHLGVVMIGESMDELVADMELFAERVLPVFR